MNRNRIFLHIIFSFLKALPELGYISFVGIVSWLIVAPNQALAIKVFEKGFTLNVLMLSAISGLVFCFSPIMDILHLSDAYWKTKQKIKAIKVFLHVAVFSSTLVIPINVITHGYFIRETINPVLFIILAATFLFTALVYSRYIRKFCRGVYA